MSISVADFVVKIAQVSLSYLVCVNLNIVFPACEKLANISIIFLKHELCEDVVS